MSIAVSEEAVRATPPVTVAGMTVMGFPLSDLVLIVTLIYTVLQIVLLIPKYYKTFVQSYKEKKDAGKRP